MWNLWNKIAVVKTVMSAGLVPVSHHPQTVSPDVIVLLPLGKWEVADTANGFTIGGFFGLKIRAFTWQ